MMSFIDPIRQWDSAQPIYKPTADIAEEATQPRAVIAPKKSFDAPLGSAQFQLDTPKKQSPSLEERYVALTTIKSTPLYLVLQATMIWLISRVIFAAFTLYAGRLQPTGSTTAAVPFLLRWDRWDATWYIGIAHTGYFNAPSQAFFPLYPLLIHAMASVIGSSQTHLVIAALIISNLATLIGMIGLAFLAWQEGATRREAYLTMLVLLAYPFAVFLVAPYTEGILLACATWGLWAARSQRWYLAAGALFLAVLSRPTGIILYAPILYEFARQHNWGRTLTWRSQPALLANIGAAPLGIGIFSYYSYRQFHDALAWIHVERIYWNRATLMPWTAIYRGIIFYIHKPINSDLLPIVVMVGVTLYMLRKQPVSFTLYMAGLLYLCISTPLIPPGTTAVQYVSSGRYLLMSIPVFLVFGKAVSRHTALNTAIVIGGIMLQSALAINFLTGLWVN